MIAVAVLVALVGVLGAQAKEQLRIGVTFKPEKCEVKSKSGDKVTTSQRSVHAASAADDEGRGVVKQTPVFLGVTQQRG
jgi:hypothetical protein